MNHLVSHEALAGGFAAALPTAPEVEFREPLRFEASRARYLFRGIPLPPGGSFLVAERMGVVPRFVAAAAWWTNGARTCFRMAHAPGVSGEIRIPLLRALARRCQAAGHAVLQYGQPMEASDPVAKLLTGEGYEIATTERIFKAPIKAARDRVRRLQQTGRIVRPRAWRTESTATAPLQGVLPLVTRYGLLPAWLIQARWRQPGPFGFDPGLSCILWDGAEVIGAFLLRQEGIHYHVDVRVVSHANLQMRALGNLCLMAHGAESLRILSDDSCLFFRADSVEHRETANLAHRLGGNELGTEHLFEKRLVPPALLTALPATHQSCS